MWDFVQTISVHNWNAYKNPKEVQTQANITDTMSVDNELGTKDSGLD